MNIDFPTRLSVLGVGVTLCMKKECFLFFHDWDGCTCRRCGKTRDKEHQWDGCVCTRCGKTRHIEHVPDERCICVRCGLREHDWEYSCVCARCGVTRDKHHDWDAEGRYCRHCGAEQVVESGLCSYCNGLGADPATYSQQSGQGGSNPCPVCRESGVETRTHVIMKSQREQ